VAKGAPFERELSKQLSLWWTADEDEPSDAVFWRTSQSGGRATTREKSGKKTTGQYGDITATDPIGQPLIELVSIEAKNGYNNRDIMQFLDAKKIPKASLLEFINQASRDALRAEVPYWWMIHKRDRKQPMLYTTPGFLLDLTKINTGIVFLSSAILTVGGRMIGAVPWEDFLNIVEAKVVKRLWRKTCSKS